MDFTKKLVMIAITAAVSIILVGSLLVPVIQGFNESTEITKTNTVNNSNLMTYTEDLTDLDVSITWTGGTNYVMNGDKRVSLSPYNSGVIVSDKGSVLFTSNITGINIRTPSDTASTDGQNIAASSCTVEITGNDATITYVDSSDQTVTVNFTDMSWVAFADSEGNYRQLQKTSEKEIYLNDQSHLFGTSWVTASSLGYWAFNNLDSNLGSMVLNKDNNDNYTDLYNFDNATDYYLDPSIAVNADGSMIVPYFIWVPINVSTHTVADQQYSDLFATIPLIVIISVLVGIVAVIFKNRE